MTGPRTTRTRLTILARGAVVAWVGALFLGACVSGRVLEGYPGYPFLSFDVPAAADSTFFALQEELRAEAFELDFTERASGLINTRPAERPSGSLFLSLVVDSLGTGARVWVAGYEPVADGARRIDPLDEEGWAEVRAIAVRISDRLGGTAPEEPPPPDGDRRDASRRFGPSIASTPAGL